MGWEKARTLWGWFGTGIRISKICIYVCMYMWNVYAYICSYIYLMYVYIYYFQTLPIEERAKNQIQPSSYSTPHIQILEIRAL